MDSLRYSQSIWERVNYIETLTKFKTTTDSIRVDPSYCLDPQEEL